jgi:hypothetical protein
VTEAVDVDDQDQFKEDEQHHRKGGAEM